MANSMASATKTPLPTTWKELYEPDLVEKGLTWDEVVEKSAEHGVSPLMYIVKIAKLYDFDELMNRWGERYEIPILPLPPAPKMTTPAYIEFSDGKIGVWSPVDYKTLKEKNPDAEIYLVPYHLFEIQDVGEAGLKGEFLNLIAKAQDIGATDVHFHVAPDSVRVYFRLFGDLLEVETLTFEHWGKMQRVIKTEAVRQKSNIDAQEHRIAQDARIYVKERKLSLRLAFTPAYGQEGLQNLVVRLLLKSPLRVKGIEDIEALGYSRKDAELLVKALSFQNGIIIVAGATGSGKSRTLNTLLALSPATKSVKTIEDPVEYELENAVQHQVSEFKNEEGEVVRFGFLEAIKAFMRQDPDIMLIGEWRKDPQLTDAIVYASETGHLVLTTLHSSRVVNVPNLLVKEYGLAPESIANNGKLFISQRLVKTVCPHCAQEREITEEDIQDWDSLPFKDRGKIKEKLLGQTAKFINPEGCEECRVNNPLTGKPVSAGIKGRTAIYEYMVFDWDVMETILRTTSSLDIEELLVSGDKGVTFIDTAIKAVLDQKVDPRTVMQILR